MKKILMFLMIVGVCFGFDINSIKPLVSDEYKKVFAKYFNEDDTAFNTHDFESDVKLHEKYCHAGLSDACESLGHSYVLGFGVKKDAKKGLEYLKYALRHAKSEIFKEYYEYSLVVANEVKDMQQGDAIVNIIRKYAKKYTDCNARKNDKDACFQMLILAGILPTDMIGVSDMSGIFELAYDNDVFINGAKNSKIAKMISEYNKILDR